MTTINESLIRMKVKISVESRSKMTNGVIPFEAFNLQSSHLISYGFYWYVDKNKIWNLEWGNLEG